MQGVTQRDRTGISSKTATDTDDAEIDGGHEKDALPAIIEEAGRGGNAILSACTKEKQRQDAESKQRHVPIFNHALPEDGP